MCISCLFSPPLMPVGQQLEWLWSEVFGGWGRGEVYLVYICVLTAIVY